MPLSRLSRLAYFALALLLAVATVSRTVPAAVVCAAVESAPNANDDEVELVAHTAVHQSPYPERLVIHFAPMPCLATVGEIPCPRATRGPRNASTDPLGGRLRC